MLTKEDYHIRASEKEPTTIQEIIDAHGVPYPAVMYALRTEKLERVGKVGKKVIISRASAEAWAEEYKLSKR